MASWTMDYTIKSITKIQTKSPEKYKKLKEKIHFNELKEVGKWTNIVDNMYFPENEELGVFLQQDGYMDKELLTVEDLKPEERPINQKWSWDRILRSCFIKQADVLQGIYLFDDQYDKETIQRNFDFYEPKTVHESSLSPCVHTILAAELGYKEKAYELYLRTARLDLDDYNDEVYQGLHITSMAGTYLSIVEGFGGMRLINDELHFNSFIPSKWNMYSFTVRYRENVLKVEVSKEKVTVSNQVGEKVRVFVRGVEYKIKERGSIDFYCN